MAFLFDQIRGKSNWQSKIHDSIITDKWKQEVQEKGQNPVLIDKIVQILQRSDEIDYNNPSKNWEKNFNKDYKYIWDQMPTIDKVCAASCKNCECGICDNPDRCKCSKHASDEYSDDEWSDDEEEDDEEAEEEEEEEEEKEEKKVEKPSRSLVKDCKCYKQTQKLSQSFM
jgi:hypothetical protein